ncbi:hypothetical protein [Modestobacter sp. SSW1-42]|uniref:hypothetical protein n=1 Tax=Modestobacter sp. SSW1-42 TaxID=596372 RepID=UPI003985D155
MDRSWRRAALIAGGVGTAAVAGCGSPSAAADAPSAAVVETPAALAGERNLVAEAYDGRYRAVASVLESPARGPQLCWSMAESLPPQCGGPDVRGWDWSAVPAESVAGTTWGHYELVGTFADGAFTLTEPALARDPGAGPGSTRPEEDRFATPCAPPAGGWMPPDPARATEGALRAAQEVAAGSPGYAGLWIDQRVPAAELTGENGNDPQRIVLNASTTADVRELEAALRQVWGGSLCVSSAPRSEADLLAVQEALRDVPEALYTVPDPFAGTVDLAVVRGTLEQQRALDEQFGAGAVRLSSQLEPID